MNVQEKEINGFTIDQFNQYGLEVGKTQGVCPWSTKCRKPANQKKQCSSYDWERGLGTCHNCNTSFQLHTYKRKGNSEKVYVKPEQSLAPNMSEKVESWFKDRGISSASLRD